LPIDYNSNCNPYDKKVPETPKVGKDGNCKLIQIGYV
jgi:hypothetical protein